MDLEVVVARQKHEVHRPRAHDLYKPARAKKALEGTTNTN